MIINSQSYQTLVFEQQSLELILLQFWLSLDPDMIESFSDIKQSWSNLCDTDLTWISIYPVLLYTDIKTVLYKSYSGILYQFCLIQTSCSLEPDLSDTDFMWFWTRSAKAKKILIEIAFRIDLLTNRFSL